ncbi:UDPGP type 1 family protein [Planctomicrobium sp.]|jgi:UDP-N-acetylglucosamine/UDP-N-acetylgalactosamine diphosphorylase|nr:UDPGP type 1 family protein [Planctomicrobium sp.]MBT5017961.1 UDPGP type 1 family protein [Planctomicrobium sp.]MDB4733623.1 UDPGP type 1 family protein [Planctomicrobium sp.]MDB4743739.1 UDPGP type 1 family protein [Planctomicrobium sp.]
MQLSEETTKSLAENQQEHLVQFWDELDEQEQSRLQKQIAEIDFALLKKLITKRDQAATEESGADKAKKATSPEQLVRLPQDEDQIEERKKAAQVGNALLASGKVGAILVAGGQGSRLGFDNPKGMYPIGPVSQRTLFEILAEQVLARSQRAGVVIPYFIMTSEATHSSTEKFFEEHEYFGLGQENIFFFQQSSLPAIDDSSHQILLAEKGKVATSPDGHGGMLNALNKHGMLDVMRERGIEHLFYHQVDNPTAIVCDPVLLGLHQQYGSDLTTKVVAKATPEEKMGVLVSINAKTEIIEYSDLPGEEAHRKDEHGQYVFWAGNTAIHVFRREFMESLLEDELSLPFHIAHKKIPHVDSAGISIDPDQPNGNKFEQFIFDALLHAKVALVVEGDRQREFNPVKNASGSDSPETSKAALARIAKEWVTTAGGEVPKNIKVEISPLLALDENDMKEILPDGTVFQKDAVLKN